MFFLAPRRGTELVQIGSQAGIQLETIVGVTGSPTHQLACCIILIHGFPFVCVSTVYMIICLPWPFTQARRKPFSVATIFPRVRVCSVCTPSTSPEPFPSGLCSTRRRPHRPVSSASNAVFPESAGYRTGNFDSPSSPLALLQSSLSDPANSKAQKLLAELCCERKRYWSLNHPKHLELGLSDTPQIYDPRLKLSSPTQ
ncbi:hypothetical protein B0H12DRAFT_198733 [Mycena haematopus]|nr:hypothetical protein B0H12DRAFT_198733 [Mycena haematopus]